MSPQIAVRLSAEEWAAVDAVVAKGRCASRAAVIREGLALFLREEREQEIVEAYRRGYEAVPYDEELDGWTARAGLAALNALQGEDPWPQDDVGADDGAP